MLEITESTTITLSVGILTSLATAITSWVTLKLTVNQQAKDHAELEQRLEKQIERIDELDAWRKREQGAELERRRHTTDRFIVSPYPASPVDTPPKKGGK
jgi:hypothetical protein